VLDSRQAARAALQGAWPEWTDACDLRKVREMERDELLERYEALGDDRDYLAAKPLYERALGEASDARLLNDYGYLLACHGQRELRRAVELYERAIELDPSYDKPHYQLLWTRASLRDPEVSVAFYERRLAAAPGEPREYRFLAHAYLLAHAFVRALEVADAGLELVPADAQLITARGEARAGLGEPEGALADWRRALELDADDIGALFSSAFLLEREHRLEEAADAWQSIVTWNESRGYALQTVWPMQERARLRAALGDA
jgi:tetratricopeptide (TPR) repeat protein